MPQSHFRNNVQVSRRKNIYPLEARGFLMALTCLEAHFQRLPGFERRTMPQVKKIVSQTLEMSLQRADVRYDIHSKTVICVLTKLREHLSKNVDIWMRLQKIFLIAVPTLVSRSLRESYTEAGIPSGLDVPESANLILKNSENLLEDLWYLNSLLVISRNMLAIKETAQEICTAVAFDKAVHKLIILCVNVTSKGYDGENVDEYSRGKLNEVTEYCKYFHHDRDSGPDEKQTRSCW